MVYRARGAQRDVHFVTILLEPRPFNPPCACCLEKLVHTDPASPSAENFQRGAGGWRRRKAGGGEGRSRHLQQVSLPLLLSEQAVPLV